MTTTNNTGSDLATTYQKAAEAVRVAEAKGMSESTMNRKYKAMFAAEDALKASGFWS